MATYTLSDLRAEVERKYAPTIIEGEYTTYTLLNMLQIPGKRQDRVMEIIDGVQEMDASGEDVSIKDQLAMFKELICLAEKDERGERLLDELGENTALIMEIATNWMESSQVGEAEASSN